MEIMEVISMLGLFCSRYFHLCLYPKLFNSRENILVRMREGSLQSELYLYMDGFRARSEGAAPPPPPFSLGFTLKTIVANRDRFSSAIAQSGLSCGYGARLRCRPKCFRPPLSAFSGSVPCLSSAKNVRLS